MITVEEFTEDFKLGHTNRVMQYIREGGDVNLTSDESGYTALMCFCNNFYYNDSMVSILLQAGANVNQKNTSGATAINYLISYDWAGGYRRKSDVYLLDLLLKHGADINNRGGLIASTPLLSACFLKNLNMVRVLLERGADWTIKDSKGNAPFDELKHRMGEGVALKVFQPYFDLQKRLEKLPPPYESEEAKRQKKIDNFEIRELSYKDNWFKTSQQDYFPNQIHIIDGEK